MIIAYLGASRKGFHADWLIYVGAVDVFGDEGVSSVIFGYYIVSVIDILSDCGAYCLLNAPAKVVVGCATSATSGHKGLVFSL